MNPAQAHDGHRGVLAAQIASIALIWIFVIGITWWIVNLIQLSIELDDAPGATVAISLVAIPVFVTLATILTYVFVGMQRDANGMAEESSDA